MSRLLLQICRGLLALIPIATGIVTMLGVKDPLYRPLGLPEASVLDSNLRFFGGIWLGIWLVPSIERQETLLRAAKPYVGFIILELLGAPLFIYWQYRLTQSVATP
jgi:hypothetical protein